MQQSPADRKGALKRIRAGKPQRAAAYDHMRALDHTLSLAGVPLSRFVVAANDITPRPLLRSEERYFVPHPEHCGGEASASLPSRAAVKDKETNTKRYELPKVQSPRPLLVIDQGSKMFSATWYMQYALNMRLWVFADPHHRTWNDTLLAVGAAGLRYLIFEFLAVLNLPFGPWSSAEWWKQLLESWDAYTSAATCDDDLFSSLYGLISMDLGQDHLVRTCPITGGSGLPNAPLSLLDVGTFPHEPMPVFRYTQGNRLPCLGLAARYSIRLVGRRRFLVVIVAPTILKERRCLSCRACGVSWVGFLVALRRTIAQTSARGRTWSGCGR